MRRESSIVAMLVSAGFGRDGWGCVTTQGSGGEHEKRRWRGGWLDLAIASKERHDCFVPEPFAERMATCCGHWVLAGLNVNSVGSPLAGVSRRVPMTGLDLRAASNYKM